MTEALSLRLAISWSVMPLNTLFRHLFCAPAVMRGMLWGYVAERGDRYQREAEETTVSDPPPPTGAGQRERVQRLVTISAQDIL